jgi:hypothetical protein
MPTGSIQNPTMGRNPTSPPATNAPPTAMRAVRDRGSHALLEEGCRGVGPTPLRVRDRQALLAVLHDLVCVASN